MSSEPAAIRDGASSRLLRVLAMATLVMLGICWPLWVEPSAIPRVPFFRAIPQSPAVLSWVLYTALVFSVSLTALFARRGPWFGLSVGLLTALVLQDQHRFQPWLYEYAVVGALLTALPRGDGLRYARWWFVSLYLYSGLSKLDRAFCDELGGLFLATAARPFQIDPMHWPEGWRVIAALAMPTMEIVVAISLLIPRTRWVGIMGAIAIHATLLGILGPFGLGHSAIVLIWNAAMAMEVWIAFGTGFEELAPPNDSANWLQRGVKGVFWVGVFLPLGERFGVCDAWPAHALYSSHGERLTVELHESELDRYPEEVRRHVIQQAESPWHRLDLTAWSRHLRGTPVYPQNRACLALAEGLAARYGGLGLTRVVVFGPAERWTGRRVRRELVGLDAIRREQVRSWLNARAAEASSRPPLAARR